MTKTLSSPMEDLDLDSFLHHHTTASSSDSDSPDATIPHRTVDASASSSSSDSDDAVSLKTINSKRPLESSSEHSSAPQSRYNHNNTLMSYCALFYGSSRPFRSDELFYGSSKSNPPVAATSMGNRSSLFGSGVRATAKPGDALAAAVAAARTVPTQFSTHLPRLFGCAGGCCLIDRRGCD
ncbi:hypothetical protein Drorol1_Dr00015371 [Drosera rotundifolia]